MHLNQQEVDRIITATLAEDGGQGDITSDILIPVDAIASVEFVSRVAHVVCGIPVVVQLLQQVDANFDYDPLVEDGDWVDAGTTLLAVKGNARRILLGERSALNILQRMCGVATLTRRYVKAIEGTSVILLDTRKTMPGLRVLDKYATVVGGAQNHRMGLDDQILIKDNHIALAGSVTAAVTLAKQQAPSAIKVEVECDTLEQVEEAIKAKADIIMLDNMSLEQMRQAVALSAGTIPLEASGNVTLDTIRSIAETGVNFISSGALTHSAGSIDIGVDINIEHHE